MFPPQRLQTFTLFTTTSVHMGCSIPEARFPTIQWMKLTLDPSSLWRGLLCGLLLHIIYTILYYTRRYNTILDYLRYYIPHSSGATFSPRMLDMSSMMGEAMRSTWDPPPKKKQDNRTFGLASKVLGRGFKYVWVPGNFGMYHVKAPRHLGLATESLWHGRGADLDKHRFSWFLGSCAQ